MVTGNCRLCAQLRNQGSEGWDRAVTPHFSTSSSRKRRRVFAPRSLPRCDYRLGISFCTLRELPTRLFRTITSKRCSTTSHHLHAVSPSTLVSKIAAVRCYARTLNIMSLQRQYLDSPSVPTPVVGPLWRLLKRQLPVLGMGSLCQ